MRVGILLIVLLSGCLSSQQIYIPREVGISGKMSRECLSTWATVGVGPFLKLSEKIEVDCWHQADHVETSKTFRLIGPAKTTQTKTTRDKDE